MVYVFAQCLALVLMCRNVVISSAYINVIAAGIIGGSGVFWPSRNIDSNSVWPPVYVFVAIIASNACSVTGSIISALFANVYVIKMASWRPP